MKENNKPFFGKEESLMLAGIAILLMIWHHLFNFQSWYSEGVGWIASLGYAGRVLTLVPAAFGNICVQMFALMSGYALFVNPKAYGSWRSRGVRLLRFLGAYWLICAFFLLVALLNDDKLPSFGNLVFNLLGRETGPGKPWVNVPFAWYVTFYIEFVLLIPFLLWLFSVKGIWKDGVALVVLIAFVFLVMRCPASGFINKFKEPITPLICVGVGIVAAKHDVFTWFHRQMGRRIPTAVYLLTIAGLMLFKYKLWSLNPMGGVDGMLSVQS